MDFDRLASATVQVTSGNSAGSGFRLARANLIVTNHHVVQSSLTKGDKIAIQSESGQAADAKVLAYSSSADRDFAILETGESTSAYPFLAVPANPRVARRGDEVAFAGFPHGIPDLLVQRATVAGSYRDVGFYIDGSVNGGNSGGPVVYADDDTVSGIITQRRFLGGAQLDALANQADALRDHFKGVGAGGQVIILGINFGAFATSTGEALDVLGSLIRANANAGLGIFFKLNFVLEEAKKSGLI